MPANDSTGDGLIECAVKQMAHDSQLDAVIGTLWPTMGEIKPIQESFHSVTTLSLATIKQLKLLQA